MTPDSPRPRQPRPREGLWNRDPLRPPSWLEKGESTANRPAWVRGTRRLRPPPCLPTSRPRSGESFSCLGEVGAERVAADLGQPTMGPAEAGEGSGRVDTVVRGAAVAEKVESGVEELHLWALAVMEWLTFCAPSGAG
jgi:hypothetical protein